MEFLKQHCINGLINTRIKMDIMKINNKDRIMMYLMVMIIADCLFFTLILILPYLGINEYRWIFIIIFICLVIETIVKTVYSKYIDIKMFQDYLVIKEFYILNSIKSKAIRTFTLPYYDLMDFYRDDKRKQLVFYVHMKDDYNTTFTFSSKYISKKAKKNMDDFLQNIIRGN